MRRARWALHLLLTATVPVTVLSGCGGEEPAPRETGVAEPEDVAAPEGATVYEIRGSAPAGDDDVALSATVHERDGVQEADVHIADLREADPSEERVSGPPGTVAEIGRHEVTILGIEEVDGADEDADGAVREIVTVAVRDLAG